MQTALGLQKANAIHHCPPPRSQTQSSEAAYSPLTGSPAIPARTDLSIYLQAPPSPVVAWNQWLPSFLRWLEPAFRDRSVLHAARQQAVLGMV